MLRINTRRTNKTIKLAGLTALAVGVLLLSGCDADGDGFGDETGHPVASSNYDGADDSGCAGFGPFSTCNNQPSPDETLPEQVSDESGCDPNGFGPFSGCGDGQADGDVETYDEATPEDMEETAYHEARHVWAAYCNGWTVISAEINTDGSGATTTEVPVDAPLIQRLALDVAGAVSDGTDEYSFDDLNQAEEAMDDAGIPSADRDQLMDDARAEANRCAANHSAEIDQTAADLLEDGKLG